MNEYDKAVEAGINSLKDGIQQLLRAMVHTFATSVLRDAAAYEIDFIRGLIEAGVTEEQIIYAMVCFSTVENEKAIADILKGFI